MKKSKHLITCVLGLSIMLLISAAPAFAVGQVDCQALAGYVTTLKDLTLEQPLTNISATWVPAAGDAPNYCEVKARIFPETDFALRLPDAWQGRYLHQGGGAWDGSIYSGLKQYATLGHVLSLGYVNSSSNGGHVGGMGSKFFGLQDPYYQQIFYPDDPTQSNPYACQKVVDFGHRALLEVPMAAKKIIKQYYGQDPHHTYYWGTSTGGREGLVSAQKYYDIYDGLFVGWPTGGHAAVCFRGAWDTYWGQTSGLSKGPIPYSQKAIVHRNAVYNKCDGIDGLVDGLIEDPRKCPFDPITELPACPGDIDAAGCFTALQRQALKEIYRGPHNSSGQLYIGQELSAEFLTNPNNGSSSGFGAALDDGLAYDYYRYLAFDPPAGPAWDPKTLDFETVPDIIKAGTCTQCYGDNCTTYKYTDELDAVTLTPNLAPNMGGYKPLMKKGGKIIMHTGFSDALVSSLTTTTHYDTVLKQMGAAKTKSFWKLYMAPGMGHGSPGVGGEATFDEYMPMLVNWVENGVEPTTLTQVRNATTYLPAQTRLLCQYPEVARYIGMGGTDNAANFMCVPPIEVSIKPETLNLKSKGVFTATISVPEGYKLKDWHIANVTCEGADMVKGGLSGNKYTAQFNRQDLVGVSTGNAVTLTVKGTFTYDGKVAQIQASDTVKVIK